jgi:hypothetical protein
MAATHGRERKEKRFSFVILGYLLYCGKKGGRKRNVGAKKRETARNPSKHRFRGGKRTRDGTARPSSRSSRSAFGSAHKRKRESHHRGRPRRRIRPLSKNVIVGRGESSSRRCRLCQRVQRRPERPRARLRGPRWPMLRAAFSASDGAREQPDLQSGGRRWRR